MYKTTLVRLYFALLLVWATGKQCFGSLFYFDTDPKHCWKVFTCIYQNKERCTKLEKKVWSLNPYNVWFTIITVFSNVKHI